MVIYSRGRGIVGLLRNSLVESILEKFKYELEKMCTQEKRQLTQICEEQEENMNLVCLTDDEPICAICKLFGKQEDHNVAKIPEAYNARKKAFIKKLHLVHKKSEEARKETEKLINELTAGATDTKVMIDAVGTGLLKDICYRMAELQAKLHHDYSTKLEKLQMTVLISTSAKKYCNNLRSQMTSSKIILKMQPPPHCSNNANASISENLRIC
ncbi:uncharacterized protein LOC142086401 isoform X2 [Calonectris borealis]|uniref:uncharacterized protein LOC142086401 isoform X2 n=1 Tax=Calonectris borealis TaxID=1323832 RepID=UPI003F4BD2CE